VEDTLKLVAARGRMMQEMPPGAMLAVFLSEDQLSPFMNDDLSLSVINSPSISVVSGEDKCIDSFETLLSKKQVICRRLHTSHAFHSKMMDPVLAPFTEQIKQFKLIPPKVPFLSNVTGTWITQEEATDPAYWARHLRSTVRFADCMHELFREPNRVFLEVGPGGTLSNLASQHPSKNKNHVIFSSMRHPKEHQSDIAFILNTLGALWTQGVQIDWRGFHSDAKRQRVLLPTYPFEHKRYWIESQNMPHEAAHGALDERQRLGCICPIEVARKEEDRKAEKKEDREDNIPPQVKRMSRSEAEQILTDIWRELIGHSQINPDDNFFALGGHSLVALRLFSRIDSIFHKRLPLATLLSAPTVRQLAGLLVQDEFEPSWSSLVRIRVEGTKLPFFSVHSEGGNVLEYFKLASYLDQDRPFYGIQAQGLDGDKIISLTIEEMARHYIAEIKSVQPKGPYFIGGYCLGGMIAFEMARQLETIGDHVAFLAMISTYTPEHLKREIPNMTGVRRYLNLIIDRIGLEMDNLSVLDLKEKLSYIGDRMRQFRLVSRVIYEDLADRLRKSFNLKPYHHSRRYILEKIRNKQAMAFYDYKPSPIETGITLFRVSRQSRSLVADPTLGWADYSKKGVVDFEVLAFHKNIMKDPNVKTLAKKLQECIDEMQRFLDKD
jgi:phthiocerol/phenolphthiocerol synthesis type-I polyketide synthase E